MNRYKLQICYAFFCLIFLHLVWISAEAGISSQVNAQLNLIFSEAKNEFFITVTKLLRHHTLRYELNPADLSKLFDARNQIPYLFERIMIIAYQKDEPQFSRWIKQGDKKSLEKFRTKFIELSRDYAGRFVGSLFRKSRSYELAIHLKHNRGKSRLELVLQTLGYKARNDLPDIPPEQWFSNKIEPEYFSQWAIEAVNARKCWSLTKGRGVIVAVVDSGIDPYNSLFKDRIVPGFNFLKRTSPPWSGENPPMIDYGLHGTGVSSALLMIAPECSIMPVRIHDSDTMNDPAFDYWLQEFMAAGIYYAVHHGAHVIQISAAVSSSEPVVAEAIRYAYYHNVIICSSAGNIPRSYLGIRPEDVLYNAFDKEVLLVGGVEKRNTDIRPWPFSVPGPYVDTAAPSKDIYVIVPVYMKEFKDGYVAGTSLSSPIVSGVLALMRSSVPPSADHLKMPGAYCRLLTQCIIKTARLNILGLAAPSEVVGRGLIDAYAAVQMIRHLTKK